MSAAAPASAARVERAADGRAAVVGPMTFATVEGLYRQAARLAPAAGAVHLDLSGVTHTDSAGLALIVEWMACAEREGASLKLAAVPEQMQAIAGASGLSALIAAHLAPDGESSGA